MTKYSSFLVLLLLVVASCNQVADDEYYNADMSSLTSYIPVQLTTDLSALSESEIQNVTFICLPQLIS